MGLTLLRPQFLRGKDNVLADAGSRVRDKEGWSLRQVAFDRLNRHWGPFTIDRFATALNTRLERFNSEFYCPESESVEALQQCWKGENNYLFPPVGLVAECLNKVRVEQVRAVIVVPEWQ